MKKYLKKLGLNNGRDIQVQEAQRVPNKMNPKRPTPRYIIKMIKVKERILKAAREKQRISHMETPMGYQLISIQKHQEGVARYIQSAEREKPAT